MSHSWLECRSTVLVPCPDRGVGRQLQKIDDDSEKVGELLRVIVKMIRCCLGFVKFSELSTSRML